MKGSFNFLKNAFEERKLIAKVKADIGEFGETDFGETDIEIRQDREGKIHTFAKGFGMHCWGFLGEDGKLYTNSDDITTNYLEVASQKALVELGHPVNVDKTFPMERKIEIKSKDIIQSSIKRGAKLKHLEPKGCIVNIREELWDVAGHEVTSIEILPDRPDWEGNMWKLEGTVNNRVIKEEKKEGSRHTAQDPKIAEVVSKLRSIATEIGDKIIYIPENGVGIKEGNLNMGNMIYFIADMLEE